MLQIKNISKTYATGELVQVALDGVTLNLRDSEFVAVLGPSGSGKTTLLNVVGGLDRYDSGDLVIDGVSTKKYGDRDWDSYRNHTVGFVFQSYNLIPHQSVLANVELALTISGVSKQERRKRAKRALEDVGLADQLHKRPNQMSGGQMQRVAIARALVNDPEILLADEPTGALDSETSASVMELLSAVAKDRLVVMVTHDSELARRYASRIVRLRDGRVISDSDPCPAGEASEPPAHRNMGRSSMSFPTSVALSFNNLRTKKGRTLLTALAGSIGIIGIALILALSNGVNDYIDDIQRETMTSYPITINSEDLDVSGMLGMRGQPSGAAEDEPSGQPGEVHSDNSALERENDFGASLVENNLTRFKKYLDDPQSEIAPYIGENGVVYTYEVAFDVYAYDADGSLVNTSASTSGGSPFGGMMGGFSQLTGGSGTGADNFSELIPGTGGEAVSRVVTDSYEVLGGAWPARADEVALVLREDGSLSADVLCQLGFITAEQLKSVRAQIAGGEQGEIFTFPYGELLGKKFSLVAACDYYAESADGTFAYLGERAAYTSQILDKSIELTVSAIVRPLPSAANANISTAVAYTSKLTELIVGHAAQSEVVTAQQNSPDVSVLTGIPFVCATNEDKTKAAKTYIGRMTTSEKASLFSAIMYKHASAEQLAGFAGAGAAMSENALAAMLDMWIRTSPDEDILLSVYEDYVAGASFEGNLSDFGRVNYDAPHSISIYADSFEAKDRIAECIENYNLSAHEDDRITYTDYVALLTSSITSIVDVISYVLIAFVSVSLVVSCIMIGIITHISVLERTKEIGILRAIGASKRNISQVFNAETLIIGLFAGLLGVGISLALTVPINALLAKLTDAGKVSASLPWTHALMLVAISVIITVLGGLIPSRRAAKKDPVAALRTE